MDHRTEQSQGTETAFLLDETKDVHQEQTPNGYSIHNTTLKLGWSNPTWSMDSTDTSSSAISLSYYTTLLTNHNATTLHSKNHLFLRSPTGTLIAEFSGNLVHTYGTLSFLRFYIIVPWQYIHLTSPSAHLSKSLFSCITLCNLNIPTFLTFLFSSVSFLFHEVKSNSEERATLLVHFNWTHKLLFHT